MHFSEQTITQLVNLPQQQEMMERYHIEDCVKEIMIEQFDTELFYISAKVDVLYYEVPCNMMVDHGRIEMHQCTCTYHTETTACAHIGAVLRKINALSISQFPFHYTKNAFSSLRYEEIQRHSMELEAKRLAYQNAKKQATNLQSSMLWLEEMKQRAFTTFEQPFLEGSIHLLPEVVKKPNDTAFCLQYRIGEDRYYKIKDLSALVEAMKKHDYVRYGKQLAFRHDLSVLDEAGKAQLNLIKETLLQSHQIAAKELIINHSNIDDFFDCYTSYPEYAPMKLHVEEGVLHLKAIQDANYITLHFIQEATYICGNQYFYALDGHTLTRYGLDDFGVVFALWKRLMESPLVLDETGFSAFTYLLDDEAMRYLRVEGIEWKQKCNIEETIHLYGDIEEDGSVSFHLERIDSDGIHHVIKDEEDCHTLNASKALYYLNEYTALKLSDHTYGFASFSEEALTFLVDHLPILASICTVYVSDRLRHIRPIATVSLKVGVRIQNQLLEVDFQEIPYDKEELLAIYQAYRRKKKYHLLKNGELLHLEDESLHQFHELITDLAIDETELMQDTCTLPLYRAFSLPQQGWYQKDETYQILQKNLDKAKTQSFPLPAMYRDLLKAYQVEGFQWLSYLKEMNLGGILADDMGLGKTIQVIALLESDHAGVSLVVTPASLLLNWADELKKFHASMKYRCIFGTQSQRETKLNHLEDVDLLITSYDYLKRDIAIYRNLQFHYVILDEAQNIKNPRTQNARSVKQLNAEHRFALSGTPIENALSELWSIFDFILPGYLYSYAYFQEQYEKPILKEDDEEKKLKLQRLVQPFILRRTKQQVLQELPAKSEKQLLIPFHEEGKRLYYANLLQMNQTLQEHSAHTDRIEVLAMLTRLRQLCCDPRLLYEDIKEPSAKLEACMELIERLCEAKQKALLFSSFTSMLSFIAIELEKRGIRYYLLKGDTTKIKRREMVNAFRNDDTPIFLISLKAGGTGLNLTAAEAVIHFDPWWNVSAQNQATDRTHRIGQKKHVQVYQLIMKDSIEEKIQNLQAAKQKLADTFIGEDQCGVASMKFEELVSLFELEESIE